MAEKNTDLTFGDRLQDWWDYTIAPFTKSIDASGDINYTEEDAQGNVTEIPREYYGARPGLDFADIPDLGYSLLSSVYRGADKALLRPLLHKAFRAATRISPDTISSDEELLDFADRYLSEEAKNIWAKPEPLTGKQRYIDYKMSSQIDYDKWPFGENYFELPREPGSPSGSSPGGVSVSPTEYTLEGYLSPYTAEGVSPFVAAEELAHAERYVTGDFIARDRGRFGSPYDLSGYISRTREELGAKAHALKNVLKHEDIGTTLRSIPEAAVSAFDYALPQTNVYKSGIAKTDPNLIEYHRSVDALESLGWLTPEGIRNDPRIKGGDFHYGLIEIWRDHYPDIPFPDETITRVMMSGMGKDPAHKDYRDIVEAMKDTTRGKKVSRIEADITRWLDRY